MTFLPMLGHWPGSKSSLMTSLSHRLPRCRTWVSVFGGLAGCLKSLPCQGQEVYNDVDPDLANLFRVIQADTQRQELAKLIRLTNRIASVQLAADVRFSTEPDPVKRAWSILVLTNGAMYEWINKPKPKPDTRDAAKHDTHWLRLPTVLEQYASRFAKLTIVNDDCIPVIKKYSRPDCLLFLDPPYSGRSLQKNWYRHNFDRHCELALWLAISKAKVIYCDNADFAHRDVFGGWGHAVFLGCKGIHSVLPARHSDLINQPYHHHVFHNFSLTIPADGLWRIVSTFAQKKG